MGRGRGTNAYGAIAANPSSLLAPMLGQHVSAYERHQSAFEAAAETLLSLKNGDPARVAATARARQAAAGLDRCIGEVRDQLAQVGRSPSVQAPPACVAAAAREAIAAAAASR